MGTSKSVEDQIAVLTSWERKDVEKGYRQYLTSFLAYEYAMILPFYGALPKEEKGLYRTEIRRCSYLLQGGKSCKLKLIRLVGMLLGIELTSRFLYGYVSRRNSKLRKQ